MMKKPRALVIVNPVAGRRKANNLLYRINEAFLRRGFGTSYFITGKSGEATELVMENGAFYDRVVCCGGDGTLNEVIKGILTSGLELPIGYIPTGTTNDLAHALNMPTNYIDAIDTACGKNIRSHDVGEFDEGLYFSYTASFGAFTKVSYETPQWLKNTFGRLAYLANGVKSLSEITSRSAHVYSNGLEVTGDFIFGCVTNSTIIGGLLKIPGEDVRFDDGLFEVLLVRRPETLEELTDIFNGIMNNDYSGENVTRFTTSHVVFDFDDETEWTIDGEFGGAKKRTEIKNLPCAVKFIC